MRLAAIYRNGPRLRTLPHGWRSVLTTISAAAATTATAHKIAIVFYTMVKNQVEYDETIWATRDAERRKRLEARFKRQAQQFGYRLVPIEENSAA